MGCAALIGAAVAFPAGVMLAGREPVAERAAPTPGSGGWGAPPGARNPYSPGLSKDPYILDQQRRMVEALEAQCRDRGVLCAQARQARDRFDRSN
ncbi:hypothetical protein [Sphingomonas sp. 3-13AW]|uniref:hypothetical protein n=1 Tax=Sphingomonas sp. 3-13AW TaxID=3050450 RepID=UPI003BB50760